MLRRLSATLAGFALAAASVGADGPAAAQSEQSSRFAGADEPAAAQSEQSGRFAGPGAELVATWRSTGRPPLGVLVDPTDVRWIDGEGGGFYLVADPALQRVQIFLPDGSPFKTLGELGEGPGQLMAPVSADAEKPGTERRLVVSDSENFKLVLFDMESGRPIRDIAFPGERPPSTVAFRPDGVIEAYDEAFAFAFEFDRNGEPLRSRVRAGERTSFAWQPGGSMLRAYGHSIEQMHTNGTQWQALRDEERPGPFEALAGGPSRWIFTYASRRVTWKPRSSYVDERTLPGGVRAIAATADEALIAAMDRSGGRQAGLYRMGLDGPSRLERWGDPLLVLGWIGQPTALTSAAGGGVYLVDGLNRVQRFDQSGSAHGQFRRNGLIRAAFGADGDAFISRTLWGASTEDGDDQDAPPPGFVRHIVERWTFGGPLTSARHEMAGGLKRWSVRWDEPLPYDPVRTTRVTALELDEFAGELVALDANQGRILRFDADDGAMTEERLPVLTGRPGWSDVAVSRGNALVLHAGARRVVEVAPGGAVARQFDTPPLAVRVSASQSDVVIATGTGWLWTLDPATAIRAAWPIADEAGPSPPSDITSGPDGLVFAGDHAAAAVRVYRPDRGIGSDTPAGPPPAAECQLEANSRMRPRLVGGQRTTVSVRIQVACPQAAAGRSPDFGLRHAQLTLHVPDGMAAVPGSASPPARHSADGLVEWELDWLPPDYTISVAVRADGVGPIQFPDAALEAVDGWYGLHSRAIPGPAVQVVEFGPRLFLPRLAMP